MIRATLGTRLHQYHFTKHIIAFMFTVLKIYNQNRSCILMLSFFNVGSMFVLNQGLGEGIKYGCHSPMLLEFKQTLSYTLCEVMKYGSHTWTLLRLPLVQPHLICKRSLWSFLLLHQRMWLPRCHLCTLCTSQVFHSLNVPYSSTPTYVLTIYDLSNDPATIPFYPVMLSPRLGHPQ